MARTLDRLTPITRALVPRGVRRCSPGAFALWLAPWFGLLAAGLYASWLCLYEGLNQTNMDNRFAFGLWIFLDLTVIAFGAGAFFSGFLLYVMKVKELRAVINSAVVIGLICYSGAVAILAIDVGQPLRAWFTFWHPNVHSMLTEVTFCITCYLVVLAIEYVPLVLKNRQLKQVPQLLVFEWELHKLMPVFALIGTLLSFFHQGSLGGLYGVLIGRPFAFREGFFLWPTTFFLFILSAAAVGPGFLALTTSCVEAIARRRLVTDAVYGKLGKISGWMLLVYVMWKSLDTLVWINGTSPRAGFSAFNFYQSPPFGTWVLFAEIVLFGFIPALMLLHKRTAGRRPFVLIAAALGCAGVALNRFVLTIQTLALPTLPFDEFMTYAPSWQESFAFLAVVAYGVILYSLSYRYLTLFPQERDLSENKRG
ncbi:MAG TPA: molybdopterin oxidoreductase [Solibacterales bacterium]|nr:molybdopterin oxidoreductase [Bryobacterales bacterium]